MRYIGIDNGTSGAIACLEPDGKVAFFGPMPSKSEQDYTKAKKTITRVNVTALEGVLFSLKAGGDARVLLERPMVMPARFMQSLSAVRALEATLIALEACLLQVQIVDSRKWQEPFLPSGTKGSADLKKASREIGSRLWPEWTAAIVKQGDADALFIAEYARRNRL